MLGIALVVSSRCQGHCSKAVAEIGRRGWPAVGRLPGRPMRAEAVRRRTLTRWEMSSVSSGSGQLLCSTAGLGSH